MAQVANFAFLENPQNCPERHKEKISLAQTTFKFLREIPQEQKPDLRQTGCPYTTQCTTRHPPHLAPDEQLDCHAGEIGNNIW
jgi:hypothetical protein